MDVLYVVLWTTDIVGGCCLVLFHWVPIWRTAGVFAVANAVAIVIGVRKGEHFGAGLNGAVCVWCAWAWWHGGGGDGTRRRLRSLGRAFRGVRRTAPSAGAS